MMSEQTKAKTLQLFLRIYGFLSLALFSALMTGFALRAPILQEGGSLCWTIWDRVSDHVGPMLFAIYIVWSIFLIRAAEDLRKNASFLDFTIWSNLAHALVMVPMALGMDRYHSKFFTDIPWILILPLALLWLRPSARSALQTA